MSRLEHSELVLGPFENLTNLGPDPLAGLFALPLLMMGIRSALVSKKSRLNLLLGGLLLIQASALLDIFAVSKILNLVDP